MTYKKFSEFSLTRAGCYFHRSSYTKLPVVCTECKAAFNFHRISAGNTSLLYTGRKFAEYACLTQTLACQLQSTNILACHNDVSEAGYYHPRLTSASCMER
jgi:hypothetical protein